MSPSRLLPIVAVIFLTVPLVPAQAQEVLSGREAADLTKRIADLMEVTRIVMPELARAGEPLRENFVQGATTLESGPSRSHAGILYRMLANAKAYLQLSETLPKPADFSEEIAEQLTELRSAVHRLDANLIATLDAREELVLGSDWDNLRRHAEANATVGDPVRRQARVVFLGDSITDGWRLDQYFPGKDYINRGISGQITSQMLGRTKPDVIGVRPRAMVLLAGTNDLARGVPNATIQHNLEAIAFLAEAISIIPVMASILPVNDYQQSRGLRFRRTTLRDPQRIAEINRWLSGLCRSNGWVYIDYHSAMVDEGGRLKRELSDDGLHPNAEGYKVMAPIAQQAIDAALRKGVSRSRRRMR